mmetsp:Transcript_118712/g.218693  ORF Transcript_118712/g.218693 Transcript_118712/m.218693 type:complete len:124 (-) Transcript_118712:46-417(-)
MTMRTFAIAAALAVAATVLIGCGEEEFTDCNNIKLTNPQRKCQFKQLPGKCCNYVQAYFDKRIPTDDGKCTAYHLYLINKMGVANKSYLDENCITNEEAWKRSVEKKKAVEAAAKPPTDLIQS